MAQLELKELPEGLSEDEYVKPVKLAKELSEAEGKDVRPQIVYGYIRNGGLQAYTKGGEGRFIVRSEFEAWVQEKAQKKAEREAKAAEKAAKKAEKEAAGETAGAEEGTEEYAG
jgi:hypothetical protein